MSLLMLGPGALIDLGSVLRQTKATYPKGRLRDGIMKMLVGGQKVWGKELYDSEQIDPAPDV